jgi:drug/metabolite transporter (DMT)-like permease
MSFVRDLRFAWLLVGAAASWGLATVISKAALATFDPFLLLPIQLAVSVTFLLLVTRLSGDRVTWSPQIRRLALLGLLNPGLSYALSLAGLALITASLSVLLWAAEPLLILLLAVLVLRDRVDASLVAVMGVAFVGVVLVVQRSGSEGAVLGVLLTLAGVGCCALYTVLCRQALVDDSTLPVVLVQQIAALGFSLALAISAALLGRVEVPLDARPLAWLSAIGSGVLYYAIAFWFYLNGLRRVPAAVAGAFINLIPVFGVTAGYILLDERLTPTQWLGAVAVLGAVSVLALRSHADTDADPVLMRPRTDGG